MCSEGPEAPGRQGAPVTANRGEIRQASGTPQAGMDRGPRGTPGAGWVAAQVIGVAALALLAAARVVPSQAGAAAGSGAYLCRLCAGVQAVTQSRSSRRTRRPRR